MLGSPACLARRDLAKQRLHHINRDRDLMSWAVLLCTPSCIPPFQQADPRSVRKLKSMRQQCRNQAVFIIQVRVREVGCFVGRLYYTCSQSIARRSHLHRLVVDILRRRRGSAEEVSMLLLLLLLLLLLAAFARTRLLL